MQFILWLLHEFWLTGREIEREITIPHTLTGVLAYGLLHGLYAFIHHQEMSLFKRLKTPRHRMAHLHIKNRHNGRFHGCGECRIIERHYLTQEDLHQ